MALLVAAHIKPRAECTDAERRDFPNNALPMCLFGCDALFERGLVLVNKGKIEVRVDPGTNDRLRAWVNSVDGRFSKAWKPGRIPYFCWHALARRRKPGGLNGTL